MSIQSSIAGRAAWSCALAIALLVSARAAPPTLEGRVVQTGRHRITVAPTGLPGQIEIVPQALDLPLALRGPRAQPTARDLLAVGRGEQLRAPVRIEFVLDGQRVAAETVGASSLELDGEVVVAEAQLAAGPLSMRVSTTYGGDGAIRVVAAPIGQPNPASRIELVLDIAGPVDTAIVAPPVSETLRLYRAAEAEVLAGDGLVWASDASHLDEARLGEGRAVAGAVSGAYVGSGDRGFTWAAPGADEWRAGTDSPGMVVIRDEAGNATWRIVLPHGPGEFSLIVHPGVDRAADRRRTAWLAWPDGEGVVRADRAAAAEATAAGALMTGPCGDALSAGATVAGTYPLTLFRYLSGTHLGLPVRLQSNASALTAPGGSPAPERMVLGRALLHDAGVDVSRLTHRTAGLRVANALARFGLFDPEAPIEFLPYWRNEAVLRYGQPFGDDEGFEINASDPLAGVHVSAWLRPRTDGEAGNECLIVVVNEGTAPVRRRLHVLDPARLFASHNALLPAEVIDGWDLSGIPEDSDWARNGLKQRAGGDRRTPPKPTLHDVEDDGFVQADVLQDELEVYGPLFVPARSFRLLRARGADRRPTGRR